ncbi:MAG: hypothetical protein QW272_08870 [Candidatus Methanomethylicaceae archaeon]
MKIFKIFKNRIIKDIFSILFIFLFFFGNIAPLTINAFSINNIERVYPYINETFNFHIPGFIPEFHAEKSPKFQKISQYGILIGIVNVDLDNNELSKIVSRGIFLGMNRDEIINEIKNKLRNKIKTIEYEEFFIKKKINIYEYSIDNNKIIINIDSLYIDKNANPGIAVIFEVYNSTIINEEFILKSKCVNENNENLGKISIDEKNFTLPNSIKLFRNERYRIKYYPNEGYEFDHWEIKNGRLSNRNNESNNVLFVQNNYGEIIAFYRKIGVVATTTTSTSTTSLKTLTTSTSSSSLRTMQTSKTQSLTSIKETKTKSETKTTSTSTITITTITSTITKVDILPPYKSESTSYKSETQTTTVTKTTTTTTSTITSITKQEKNLIDTIGETITSIGNTIVSTGKSILEGKIDIGKTISDGLTNIGKSIIEGINDISKHILHGLGLYEENISFSKTNCITTKTDSQTYKANVTYIGKTSSQTIKVTSTTTKTNITITTSIKTTSSNTITTISNYKYVTTKTLITTTSSSYNIDKHILHSLGYYEKEYKENYNIASTTSIKTTTSSSKIDTTTKISSSTTTKKTISSTSYNIDRHILNNLEYYENNYYNNYGSGKIRSSLLSHPIIYKEFLEKIKKIEENKNNIKHQYIPSYQILKYLVFKIVPIRINLDNNLEDSKIYKINIVINNYDNIDRNFIISIEAIKGGTNGFFLNEKIENLDLEKIEGITKDKLDISIKANEIKEIKSQVFFLPPIDILKECGIINPHSIIYSKKYRISIYTDSKRIFEKEIIVWPSSFLTPFWKGFYKALSENWPSLALSTIALILIGVASGGAGIAAKTASMALFAMFLYSVGMNIMELYYAYIGYDSFNKFIDKRYEIIRNNYGSDIEEYVRKDEEGYINEVRGMYAADSISNFFINIEISDLLKISGIIEVDEEEKGYAAGKIFLAAYTLGTFAIGYVYNSLKNKIINKGGIYYTKEILKAWVTAPLIDALTIFYKYKQIKSLKERGVDISKFNSKIDEFVKKLDEIAIKDKEIGSDVNNIQNYVFDVNTWSMHCEALNNFLKKNVKFSEDMSISEFVNKIKILKSCSEIYYKCLEIVKKAYNGEPNNKVYGKINEEKASRILNIIGEEIKENGINEANKYEIFLKGLSKLGIEKKKITKDLRVLISKSTLENMIKLSLGKDIKVSEGDYLVFRIFTEDKGPNFIIAKINEEKEQYKFGAEGFQEKIGTNEFFIKVEGIIKNPKDWYNNLIKGKFDEIKINDDHIIKILSENEIKIINKKLNLERIIKLKDIDFLFIDQGRFLGIKGEIITEFNEIKLRGTRMAIVTDGDGNIFSEILFEGDHGRKITDIEFGDDVLRFRYKHGVGEEEKSWHLAYYKIKDQDIKIDSSEFYISKKVAERYHKEASQGKGLIGELIAAIIEKIRSGTCKLIEVAGGVSSPEGKADLHIVKINEKIYPEEVKSTGDYTIEDIKTNPEKVNALFNRRFKEAKGQIINDLKNRGFYKKSEYGIVAVIGIPKDAIVTNDGYVKIDVLIAKVYSDGTYDILYKPSWWKPT